MKSKNMMLMVVAIGCGLVAAFLTARLGSTTREVDTVDVPVAAVDLPQGTQLKELPKQFQIKKFLKGAEPPEFISDPKILEGKFLQKTLRPGDHVRDQDLSNEPGFKLPPGHMAIGVRVTPEQVAGGFVLPGSRVDLVAMMRNKDGKTARYGVVLQNVLVVAVDIKDRRDEERAFKSVNTVTLAVKQSDGAAIAAVSRVAEMHLLLRNPGDETITKTNFSLEEFLAGELDSKSSSAKSGGASDSGEPAIETVQIPVALEDIPAGTTITDPARFFKNHPFIVPFPSNAVRTMDDLTGKTLTKPVLANQFVPKAALEGEVPSPEPPKKEEVVKAPEPVVVQRQPNQHLMVIQNGQQKPALVRFVDGVVDDGSPRAPVPAPAPAPVPEPRNGDGSN